MITVFYAGKVVERFPTYMAFTMYSRRDVGNEIFNGAYVYAPDSKPMWYRMDMTPVLLEDVPKSLRLAVMVLP